jgi:hypothetical protein
MKRAQMIERRRMKKRKSLFAFGFFSSTFSSCDCGTLANECVLTDSRLKTIRASFTFKRDLGGRAFSLRETATTTCGFRRLNRLCRMSVRVSRRRRSCISRIRILAEVFKVTSIAAASRVISERSRSRRSNLFYAVSGSQRARLFRLFRDWNRRSGFFQKFCNFLPKA